MWNPCDECNLRVVQMVLIGHHIPDTMEWNPETGEASIHRVIYYTTCGKNKRHGIIAPAGEVFDMTHRLDVGSCAIRLERVLGSVRAIRAVMNTHVFLTQIRFVADA